MPRPGSLIPPAFFVRPVAEVAVALLGAQLRHGEVTLRITEVEAYGGPEDSASHCRFGRTPRNAPMWRTGGRAYVYFCYGMHHLLNVVTGAEDEGAAVLIRSCEPVAGLNQVRARREQLREERRKMVEDLGKGDIGYIHLQAMGTRDIAEFARQFYPVFNRKAMLDATEGILADNGIRAQASDELLKVWQNR